MEDENTELVAKAVLETLPGADEDTRYRVWQAIYEMQEGLHNDDQETIDKIRGDYTGISPRREEG